ncbi:glycosyltransferase family 4 protein [Flavobacterium chuncheonense]|uniref:Glycosyltransferase family 4 protein n=1 Tax=Flavobacterium chuncheonense TaxID=2026653 RepID=A0ABW5YIY3_9FLAO
MKKILYLHQYFKFPNENGGTRSYDLSHSFIKKDYQVEVITTTADVKYKENKWTKVEKDGIIVHYLYLPYNNTMGVMQRIMVFLKFLYFATFKLLKLEGDIVLATSTPLTIGIPALLKKAHSKTPYIFEVRDVWPEAVIAIGVIKNKVLQKVLYALESKIYKHASTIVPLSTDMQHSIVRRYPQFENKTDVVIENIAEINRFQNNNNTINIEAIIGFNPSFSVLYAGTFGKVNGVNKFIELAERTLVLDPKLVFILIGSGAEKESIKELALRNKVLNKNVFILDSISKSELPAWYNAVSMGASFVVDIPELWANSANKFFDTLAASKPILINHEGWQADAIRSRNIGYVLPFNITEKTAKDFVEYTLNKELIEVQKKNSLYLAKEKFSLEKATESYLKILEKNIAYV